MKTPTVIVMLLAHPGGPSIHTKADGFIDDKCSLYLVGGELNKHLDVRDFTSY